jgi:hypothetical protein
LTPDLEIAMPASPELVDNTCPKTI